MEPSLRSVPRPGASKRFLLLGGSALIAAAGSGNCKPNPLRARKDLFMQAMHQGRRGNSKSIRLLMDVALGRQPADLAVVNARLVNVYSAEVLERHAVCIKGRFIAYVGEDPEPSIGTETAVIDAAGKTLIPGLIDGHTHLAWLCSPERHLEHLMKGGTTTLVTESMEVYPVAGLAGVLDFLDSLKDQPIKVFATAPVMASISRKARGIERRDLETLLARDDVVGLGEAYWQSVLQDPDSLMDELELALASGKPLEGHTAGASGRKLAAYLAAGISSCHEPIKAGEVLERLRQGLHVMIREGSIRRDLEQIARIREARIDPRRLVLVTDGLTPGDLIEKGGMEFVLQKAVDCGFDPITSVQMATLNVAEHFRLDGAIGGIAPGRLADMVLIPDLHTFRAETVISNGRVIAENGRLLVQPRKPTYRAESLATVHLPQNFTPDEFAVEAPSGRKSVRVRVIEMVTDLVTRENVEVLSTRDGRIGADPAQGLLKVAAVDRAQVPGKIAVGLIRGFGLTAGAIACSAAWDTSDIVVVGADDADMAGAVNRIRTLQGGAVVCVKGEIRAELALPVFGLMSAEPVEIVAEKMTAIAATVASLGCRFPDPLLSLITLTGAAIPFLRICEEGLVDLKSGKTVSLFVEA
jgi:adenine deaminase